MIRSTQKILEAALVANPEDKAGHYAYADFLMEKGDVRGEFIQIQLQLEDEKLSKKSRQKLSQQEEALLKKHRNEWLGPLSSIKDLMVRFRRGWIDSIFLRLLTVNDARILAKAAEVRLLREFTNYEVEFETPKKDFPLGKDVPARSKQGCYGLYPLQKSPYLGNLRKVHIGILSAWDPYHKTDSWNEGHEGIPPFLQATPNLQELGLNCYATNWETLFPKIPKLAELQSLYIFSGYNLDLEKHITIQNFPKLENLTIEYEDVLLEIVSNTIGPANFTRYFQSPHLPKLKHLEIRRSMMGDEGCLALVQSGILKSLKKLILPLACITNEGIDYLAECPDLKNLEVLDLSMNRLTRAGSRKLKKAISHVIANKIVEEGSELEDRILFESENNSYEEFNLEDMMLYESDHE